MKPNISTVHQKTDLIPAGVSHGPNLTVVLLCAHQIAYHGAYVAMRLFRCCALNAVEFVTTHVQLRKFCVMLVAGGRSSKPL